MRALKAIAARTSEISFLQSGCAVADGVGSDSTNSKRTLGPGIRPQGFLAWQRGALAVAPALSAARA